MNKYLITKGTTMECENHSYEINFHIAVGRVSIQAILKCMGMGDILVAGKGFVVC